MLVITFIFVPASVMTIMIFDSAGTGWSWGKYVEAWSIIIMVGLLDLLFIFSTVRLLRQIFHYNRPSNRPEYWLFCA